MLALENMRIGLSGAMPDQADLERYGWSDLDIRTTVLRLVEAVLGHGGHLVHGTHPSFIPLIRRAAETQAEIFAGLHPVTMYVVAPYLKTHEREQLIEQHSWYADIIFIGDIAPPTADRKTIARIQDDALEKMRGQMIESIDALVCVGGRIKKNKEPGVAAECRLAVQLEKPVYLAAGVGGFTQFVHQHLPPLLPNRLSEQENARLNQTANPMEIVSLVTRGLMQLHSHS